MIPFGDTLLAFACCVVCTQVPDDAVIACHGIRQWLWGVSWSTLCCHLWQAFCQSHLAFCQSHLAFCQSHLAFCQSHWAFCQSQTSFAKGTGKPAIPFGKENAVGVGLKLLSQLAAKTLLQHGTVTKSIRGPRINWEINKEIKKHQRNTRWKINININTY